MVNGQCSAMCNERSARLLLSICQCVTAYLLVSKMCECNNITLTSS